MKLKKIFHIYYFFTPGYSGWDTMIQNRFLISHEGYRLTLLAFDQSRNDLQIPTVNMTVNGYFQIQKFKFRKHTFLLTQIPNH